MVPLELLWSTVVSSGPLYTIYYYFGVQVLFFVVIQVKPYRIIMTLFQQSYLGPIQSFKSLLQASGFGFGGQKASLFLLNKCTLYNCFQICSQEKEKLVLSELVAKE